MPKKNEKHYLLGNTENGYRPFLIPFKSSDCIGLTFMQIVKIHQKYNIDEPKNERNELIVITKMEEVILQCLIRDDVCVEAHYNIK